MGTEAARVEEWQRLYAAAVRLKELAPWEWVSETEVFGVENPETGERGFVSIMGELGEHLSLALYLGSEGLYGFWGMQELGPEGVAEALFQIRHMQASFEDRNMLTDQDRRQIKELGFKFRGRQAWPMFRSYRPGYYPWYLEGPEVRFLTHALEQALEMAPRIKEDRDIVFPGSAEDKIPQLLMRAARAEGEGLAWEDRVVEVPLPEPRPIPISIDRGALERAKRLPRSNLVLETDFFLLPVQVGERGQRPAMPYDLLVVDQGSGMVLAAELLQAETTLEELWGQVPAKLVSVFNRMGGVPRQVRVRTPLMYELLGVLAKQLRFDLRHVRALPMLEEAKAFLMQRFF